MGVGFWSEMDSAPYGIKVLVAGGEVTTPVAAILYEDDVWWSEGEENFDAYMDEGCGCPTVIGVEVYPLCWMYIPSVPEEYANKYMFDEDDDGR